MLKKKTAMSTSGLSKSSFTIRPHQPKCEWASVLLHSTICKVSELQCFGDNLGRLVDAPISSNPAFPEVECH